MMFVENDSGHYSFDRTTDGLKRSFDIVIQKEKRAYVDGFQRPRGTSI
jgi:hypothetical protein